MKHTILFIDDEERILRSLKMLFMKEYNVKITTDYREALSILMQETVHAIISDQRMPDITGVELLKKARMISPNTMRLLLTGYSDLVAIVGSINEGEIFRYISKPWQTDELKKSVKDAVEIAERLMTDNIDYNDSKKYPNLQESYDLMVIDSDKDIFSSIYNLYGIIHKIHYAESLESAFEILSSSNRISIIISDIFIKGQDISLGIKMLKQHNPGILTVIVTSFQDANALIKLVNEGQVYRFLPKPVSIKLLEKSVAAAISYHNIIKRTPQLAMRHMVKQQEEKPTATGLSFKIMDYLKKIGNRQQAYEY